MKNFIILLLALFSTTLAFGEKKPKVDPKDLKIDSLTKVNNLLSIKLDSLIKVTDSLSARMDSAFKANELKATVLADSVSTLKKENVESTKVISNVTERESANNRLVAELKALKELLDSKILTQAEFDVRKAKVLQRWND